MDIKTTYRSFEANSDANRRLLRQEELILEVTEALVQGLERAGISQAELAARLGKTKGFISQILAGGRNLTLRTVADFADAMGQHISVKVCERDEWVRTTLRNEPSKVVVWSTPRPFKLVRSVDAQAAKGSATIEAVA